MTPTVQDHTAIPEDVMEAARKAANGCFDGTSIKSNQGKIAIALAIMAATEAERERCAKIVDETQGWAGTYALLDSVAAAIRAVTKGETP